MHLIMSLPFSLTSCTDVVTGSDITIGDWRPGTTRGCKVGKLHHHHEDSGHPICTSHHHGSARVPRTDD